MTQDLGECGPLSGIGYKHAGKEMFAVWAGTQPYRVFDLSFSDLGMQGRYALAFKRHLPTHKDVKEHPKAPYIDLGAYVWLGIQDSWSSDWVV